MQTIDYRGRRHIIIKSTGFASMRVTLIGAVWADGRPEAPLVIHKGKEKESDIERQSGPILYTFQKKAWVNQGLIIKWIQSIFPLIDTSPGKCIVWDSCRAHVSKKVKEYCRSRCIEMIVIPGGLTPYLQAGDIGIFKNFKDRLSAEIDGWKTRERENMQRTANGNPKPPDPAVVRRWVLNAWRGVPSEVINHSINAAGFTRNVKDWHISRHDVYGAMFMDAWNRTQGTIDVDPQEFEEIGQEDDMDVIDDCLVDLQYDE
jgi:hypothetical protein